MYNNHYSSQYSHLQPIPINYQNNMYNNNYNQQPAYNAPPPTQTAAAFISSNVPTIQRPEVYSGQNVTSLWMGNLKPYMTENFIMEAFQKLGEDPKRVKLMRNKSDVKITEGYAFVDFNDPGYIIHKLNGKFIPGTNSSVIFKLNYAANSGKINTSGNNFSVWLGNLSSNVDDFELFRTFSWLYKSIYTAKVVLDRHGYSKGFGFIRFHSEEEQKHCLKNMNGFPGLGSKPIKVSSVVSESKRHIVASSNDSKRFKANQDYGQYFETNDNLNPVDHKKSIDKDAFDKNLVTQDYNLWKGFPNFFGWRHPS